MASLAVTVQVERECFSVTLDLSWTADRLQDSVHAAILKRVKRCILDKTSAPGQFTKPYYTSVVKSDMACSQL